MANLYRPASLAISVRRPDVRASACSFLNMPPKVTGGEAAPPLQLYVFATALLQRCCTSGSLSLQAICLCLLGLLAAQPTFGNEANIVRSLIISGNLSFSRQQLRSLMQTDVGILYDAAVLKKDFEAIARFYRKNGLRFARVAEEKLSVKKFEDGVYLGIEIDEGIIGEITLDGNAKTKAEVILQELLFEVGDVYTEDDAEESERILREKAYIGAAKIEARWHEELKTVLAHVTIKELWSFPIALDPSQLLNSHSKSFFAQVRDPNLFGSGQAGQVRYERISEVGEKTRGFFTWKYRTPRLVNSHWNFNGEYIQKREGDSWAVLLERPQYTLKSRWSARFSLSESIDEVSWYEAGTRTDTFERNIQAVSGRVLRYFGDRHRQNYIGLWTTSQRSKYSPIEKFEVSLAAPPNRDTKLIGFTVGRQRVAYHQTRFLRGMGRVEDFFNGAQYGASLGYASPLYGADRAEAYTKIAFGSGWVRPNRFFGATIIEFSTYFTTRIERSILQAQTSWFYTDVFNTGALYTVDKGFRSNGLFDFHQTFVAQFKTEMQFGWSGESQVILGSFNGLRGYGYRQFSGEKMMLLSLESRTVCGGTLFRKIDEGIAAVATLFSKPFIKNPVNLGLVLSVTAFADIGYIWNGQHTFNLSEPKRSVGFGLRGSFAQVSSAGIFRVELVFPLDPPFTPSFKPQLVYGIERVF